jgi:hypothetical protein
MSGNGSPRDQADRVLRANRAAGPRFASAFARRMTPTPSSGSISIHAENPTVDPVCPMEVRPSTVVVFIP